MRRLVRIALAIVAGLTAAWAGWLYGQQPAWTSGPFPPGLVIGFNGDGSRLLGVYAVTDANGNRTGVRIVRFDTVSGEAAGEVSLDGDLKSYPLIHRDFIALSLERGAATENCLTLYDDATGHVVRLPNGDAFPESVSPDRRWLAARDDDIGGFVLISLAEGTVVRRLPPDAGGAITTTAFVPDGRRMAMMHQPGEKDRCEWIEVVELTTGRLLRRFDVPANSYLSQYLHWPDPNRVLFYGREWFSFDPAEGNSDPARREPQLNDPEGGRLLTVTSVHAAFVESYDLEPWQTWLNRQAARFSVKPFAKQPERVRVSVIDWRSESRLAQWVAAGHTFVVSPDGRRFACITREESRVQLWDANSLSPATWSGIGGVAAFAAVVLLTRPWSRRPLTALS